MRKKKALNEELDRNVVFYRADATIPPTPSAHEICFGTFR